MTVQLVALLAQQLLFLFGVGFLLANLKVGIELLRYRRQRDEALLVWPLAYNPQQRISLLLGIVQGLLLVSFVLLRRPPQQLFGLAMMFVYFLVTAPLSTRIARGFYRRGVWSDSGFVKWEHISGVAWREEGGRGPLLLISHIRNIAKRLHVPGPLYGEVRKLLREKVQNHDLHLSGAGLDLGSRDQRDSV